jgi:hypothetical protein
VEAASAFQFPPRRGRLGGHALGWPVGLLGHLDETDDEADVPRPGDLHGDPVRAAGTKHDPGVRLELGPALPMAVLVSRTSITWSASKWAISLPFTQKASPWPNMDPPTMTPGTFVSS